ncbi:MAG: Rrf2 family transcriptional regulator [Patulibacter minatonensis]
MPGPLNAQFAVAVHALTLLTSEGGAPQSSEQMSRSIAANPVHIRRVLGRLREAGLVTSRPGAKGGWHLTRSASAVSLGDVWRAVQGQSPVFGLHGVQPGCPVGRGVTTALTVLDQQLTDSVVAQLDDITVAALIPDFAGVEPG